MFLQPKDSDVFRIKYVVIEHYVAYDAYLLTGPTLRWALGG